jgi:plasmid maintenance system antidote protein VapI
MKDRLKLILDYYKLSNVSFAESVELQESTVRAILTGKTMKISGPMLLALMEIYNINPAWFIRGEGEMFLSKVVETDMSKTTSQTKTNGHLTGIDGSVETYPGIKDVEQISRTKWFEKYSSDKKTIVAANDELIDGESLHDLAVHMMYLVKMQREKLDRLKQSSDEKPMNQKGEAG